jgi:chromate transporter
MSESAAASPASAPLPAPAPLPNVPTHADLFLAFFKISLSGFGGTLPWTQRMFVEKKRWMTAKEFNDAYAVCQFLPGPNIVNLTSVFGSRMRGATGALAAWAGFLGMPFVLMVTIGMLYAQFGDAAVLRRILGGVAAAAAGVMISTVTKMAEPLFRAPVGPAPFVVLATVAAIGIMRWPLLWVMVILVPCSIALASWVRR